MMLIEMASFQVTLYRKSIKNINLRIDAAGDIKVSAPMRLPLPLIQQFIEEKSDWIRVRQDRLKSKKASPPKRFETGEYHYFLGHPYQLLVSPRLKKPHISLQHDVMHCEVNDPMNFEEKKALIDSFYRKELKQRLPALIEKWEKIIGVQILSWGVKAMKTRWGSCNPRRQRIWLNLNLIHKPQICLEYVIVHELIHLIEANHSTRFYQLMENFMPEWRTYQRLLESNRMPPM